MGDDLNAISAPEGRNNQAANQNSAEERRSDTPKDVSAANRNKGRKPKSTEKLFDVIFAVLEILALICWILAEVFHDGGHVVVYGTLLWMAMAFFLAGGAHVANKALKWKKTVWGIYCLLCLSLAGVLFLALKEPTSNPNAPLAFAMLSPYEKDVAIDLTNEFLLHRTKTDARGFIIVPVRSADTNVPVFFGVRNTSLTESEEGVSLMAGCGTNSELNFAAGWTTRIMRTPDGPDDMEVMSTDPFTLAPNTGEYSTVIDLDFPLQRKSIFTTVGLMARNKDGRGPIPILTHMLFVRIPERSNPKPPYVFLPPSMNIDLHSNDLYTFPQ